MKEGPYEAVVLGSLSWQELMGALPEPVYDALARGIPVYLDPEGLPVSAANRALAAEVSGRKRQLRALGIRLPEGSRPWITAAEARKMKGRGPGSNARMTPLAREILEGQD